MMRTVVAKFSVEFSLSALTSFVNRLAAARLTWLVGMNKAVLQGRMG